MGTAVGIHVPALASQEFIVLGQHKTVCHSIFAFTTYLWLNYSNTLKLPYIAMHSYTIPYSSPLPITAGRVIAQPVQEPGEAQRGLVISTIRYHKHA